MTPPSTSGQALPRTRWGRMRTSVMVVLFLTVLALVFFWLAQTFL